MDDLINLIFIVVGFVLVLASLALPRMLRPATVPPASGSAAPSKTEQDRRALERIEQSLITLEETARDIFGRLDTRTRVLVRLIETAEVKTQQLEELMKRHGGEA